MPKTLGESSKLSNAQSSVSSNKKHVDDNLPGPSHSASSASKVTQVKETVQIEGLKRSLNIVLPNNGPSSREEYVDYALDMLVHNLIGAGQLDPSKAHLLKTADVRDHIRSLADKAADAKQAGRKAQIAPKPTMTRWALQPNSVPITIVTNRNPFEKPKRSKERRNTLSVPVSRHATSQAVVAKKASSPSQRLYRSTSRFSKSTTNDDIWENTPYSNSMNSLNRESSMIISEDADTTYENEKSKTRQSSLLNTANRRSKTGNSSSDSKLSVVKEETPKIETDKSKASTKTEKKSTTSSLAKNSEEGFKAKLDMRGFKNEEISLDLDGRTLTITGKRGKRDGLNSRKATETLDIPREINIDHLKIARRMDGFLVIQEAADFK